MNEKKVTLKLIVIIGTLLLLILVVASIGNVTIPLNEFFAIVGSKLPFINQLIDTSHIEKSHMTIVLNLRLPRILLSMFAGFGLAYSGVVYQGVFKNPMAEPYLLGVSSGAALGATIGSVFPLSIRLLGFSYVSLLAFIGALGVLYLIFAFTASRSGSSMNVLLLTGIAINAFISSIISLIMMFNHDKIADVYFWTMGSFQAASYDKIIIVGLVVFGTTLVTIPYHRHIDIMLLGDEQAMSLGVDVAKIKKRLLIITSLMTAVIVASCGIIGFVGLIVPHVVRVVIGPSHRRLLFYSMLVGGIFMILSDTVARSILENKEISTGIITSLIGVPFFIWMLIKNRQNVN